MSSAAFTDCLEFQKVASWRCSVCKTLYCSLQCQSAEWEDHIILCQPLPPLLWVSLLSTEREDQQTVNDLDLSLKRRHRTLSLPPFPLLVSRQNLSSINRRRRDRETEEREGGQVFSQSQRKAPVEMSDLRGVRKPK